MKIHRFRLQGLSVFRNLTTKILGKEKVMFQKDHIGLDIKETKSNPSMIEGIKFKRHRSFLILRGMSEKL